MNFTIKQGIIMLVASIIMSLVAYLAFSVYSSIQTSSIIVGMIFFSILFNGFLIENLEKKQEKLKEEGELGYIPSFIKDALNEKKKEGESTYITKNV